MGSAQATGLHAGVPEDAHEVVARWVSLAMAEAGADTAGGKRKRGRLAWKARIEVVMADRYAWDEIQPGVVYAEKPRPRHVSATSLDISETGMGLLAERVIPAGSSITLKYVGPEGPWPLVPANVKHCVMGVDGYRVGVRFDPRNEKWSSRFSEVKAYAFAVLLLVGIVLLALLIRWYERL